MAEDGLEKFQAMLGAISNMAGAEPGLTDARCPKCDARDFVKVSDLYDESVRLINRDDAAAKVVAEGGMTNLQIVERMGPPLRKTATIATIGLAIPLGAAAAYVYHRFGPVLGQVATMVAIVASLVRLMTKSRQVSDDYYHRRAEWNRLYMCRRCGQLVKA
jgi:DNA-directed RNA polymerase subunit RPC12/RpoP